MFAITSNILSGIAFLNINNDKIGKIAKIDNWKIRTSIYQNIFQVKKVKVFTVDKIIFMVLFSFSWESEVNI